MAPAVRMTFKDVRDTMAWASFLRTHMPVAV